MPKRFSTKALTVIQEPAPWRTGVGIFTFLDDYSVYHYGRMPDTIPHKGEAICRMAADNFRRLAQHGISSHFRASPSPTEIEFKLVRVLNPHLKPIPLGERNYFVPLQVIFRNTLPPGSSVFRRLNARKSTLKRLGLSRMPEPGERLERPLIEFTTKLEIIDRFIDEDYARSLAALSLDQMLQLKSLTLQVNDVITAAAESVGLEHADGKIEFAIDDSGEIMLVDVAGTPDENRFLFSGNHLGKQIMRDYYAVAELEEHVQAWAAMNRPKETWPVPDPLPAEMLTLVSNVYKALCERWTGERIWGAPSLNDIVESLSRVRNAQKYSAPPLEVSNGDLKKVQ